MLCKVRQKKRDSLSPKFRREKTAGDPTRVADASATDVFFSGLQPSGSDDRAAKGSQNDLSRGRHVRFT
jgi:hypothetical protein